MSQNGTMTFEDIYGAGSLDTLGGSTGGETQQKANPNNSDVTGQVSPEKTGIAHVFKGGNILGQPLVIWFGLIALLIGIKVAVEVAD